MTLRAGHTGQIIARKARGMEGRVGTLRLFILFACSGYLWMCPKAVVFSVRRCGCGCGCVIIIIAADTLYPGLLLYADS